MGQAQFKEKLGERGKITGEKTFNKSTGNAGNSPNSPQSRWQGTTKGATTHKKPKG